MAFNLKNETLFHPAIREAEARRTTAYAIKMGWLKPAPSSAPIQLPADKKHQTLNCEDFRTDLPPATV